ncbi:Rho guanine nucleotide exchange factor scd1 [Fusarium oxysporum f. sp. albedinis]|nr:Rho guanine nucleotide exchange factor scd1 [Fusarium oxysporum f. sp. albedinis]
MSMRLCTEVVPGSLWSLIARVCFRFHVPYSLLSRRQFKDSGLRYTNPNSDNEQRQRGTNPGRVLRRHGTRDFRSFDEAERLMQSMHSYKA